MDYSQLSKEELISQLHKKDLFIDEFMREKESSEHLNFPWTGNLGHWYWNVQNNSVLFNSKKVTVLGYNFSEIPEDVGFQFFTEKLHPDDYEPVMQNMRDHLSGNSPAYEVEYRIQTKDNKWKWFYDRGIITKYDNTGKPLFLTGIVFDITQKKIMEEYKSKLIRQLSDQLSVKENMYSVIFHDLNTPISNLVNFSYLLQENLDQSDFPDHIQRYIENIYLSANQAMEVTNTLIDWVKAKKETQVKKEIVELRNVVAGIIDELNTTITSKKIIIENNIDHHVQVNSYKPVLKIAIRNFISNAVKYSFENGTVSVSYTNNILTITDNGIGMSEEQAKDLFTGNLASLPGTNDEGGKGIGLLLVKELLDQTGINVTVESGEKEGTTIQLFLA
ncbi:MAG: PAS domain-containing protein [Bacteroidetes bacterium]|jgi:PAS domain S-box-containing protein|nr:PAS domain-containing protein [Bacteroidota bacterium]